MVDYVAARFSMILSLEWMAHVGLNAVFSFHGSVLVDELRIGDATTTAWQEWIHSGREMDDVVKKDAEEAAAVSAALHLDGAPRDVSDTSSRPVLSQEVQSFKARTPDEPSTPTSVQLWNKSVNFYLVEKNDVVERLWFQMKLWVT